MKKYTFTGKTKVVNGITVNQIKALRDFSDVEKGDIGGYIEIEYNLSHDDDCWVYDDAIVMGSAHVIEDAVIREDAIVKGMATISGVAIVRHDAVVSGQSRIGEKAFVGGKSMVNDTAIVLGNVSLQNNCSVGEDAVLIGNASIGGNAIIKGRTRVTDDALVIEDAIIEGDVTIGKGAVVRGVAVIKSYEDIMIFKNNWSSNRYFTWTKSNDMWSVGCFFGTGEELIDKAFEDDAKKYEVYKLFVDLVNKKKRIDEKYKKENELSF